ncbi:retrovirus-related pol polyprotein from transposon TNT 1-94 [Tanacetum coccineum]
MSVAIPPIPPPFGASSGNPGSPNANRVDTMPTTTDPSNTTTMTNIAQSVVDENLPQLLDLRGGSHVTNVPAFDKENFTSWKVRFLVFLDGLEPYLLKTLEDGPFVPMSSLSTTENPLPKRQNQWSNAESRLANQDKRLKSIIISCLPNDVVKYIIKCKTAKEMWNDLILAHEGPSDTRDTKIAALRLKFNAFKSLEGEKVMGTFTRLKCLLNDLDNNGVTIPQAEVNATFVNSLPRKWLSMNQTQRANNSFKNDSLATLYGKYNYEEGLIDQIYESETQRLSIQASSSKALISNTQFQESDSDVEEDQRTSNEFIADLNAEYHERALLENQKRFYKRSRRVGSESVSSKDEGTTRIRAFMEIAEDEPSVEKADARSGQWVDITMKKVHKLLSLTDSDDRKHVLDYTHVDLIYVEDQRKNMVNKYNLLKQELSLHKSELSNLKNIVSIQNEVIRVNLENESLKDEISDLKRPLEEKIGEKRTTPLRKFYSSRLMYPHLNPSGASKSLISLSDLTANMADLTLNTASKEIKKSSNKVSQTYVIKKRTKSKHPTVQNSCPDKNALPSTEQLLLTLMEEVKGIKNQILIPSDTSSSVSQACSSKTPKQKDYLKRFVWYLDNGHSRHMTGVKQYLYRYLKEPGPKVVFGDDSLGDTEGYGSVNCNGITFTRVAYVNGLKHNLISTSQLCDANFKVLFTKTQGTIFNQNDEVVLIAPRRRDVYIIDMSSFNKGSNACFLAKASLRVNWLWHKRLSHLNFKNIINLAKHNLVFGLPSLTFSKDKNCSACEKGKHHRASFKTKRSFSINKYTWVFCLKKKSDAADCIMSFIRKMKNLNEVRVNELRSDNGTEFRNHKLKEFCDEKGISQNFSSPCTPEQNGIAERRNRTLIKAARTMLNSAKLPKQFWGEAVNTACYTQNRSIIVKRHRKTAYDVFRGRSPDISYFYVFGCPVHIYNHRDHLGKFDEKADDGLFLGYSPVAKAFRVFNIKRQEMEETVHVTFSEDDEAISQTSIEGDAINFNENRSSPNDEFVKPRTKDTQCSINIEYFPYVSTYENITSTILPTLQNSVTSEEPPEFTIAGDLPAIHKPDHAGSADILESAEPQYNVLSESISDDQPALVISPSAEVILQNPIPQDRWSREKHIELVNIISELLAGITTKSRIRELDAASAHECLYVNFLSEIEPKKLIKALEEEGWVIAMQEELNQFERNKVWTLVPKPLGKTIIGTKWIWKNKMDEEGVVIKNKSRLMDVKSAFLNGKISEEVYVQQPPGFESSEFPDHVCKLDKALYGLKQAPRAWYQANPKESHLVVVKRIFRYLKGTPNLGLWYPKGSGFDLKAYSDSDYAGCNLDRKSTSGGCQILGGKLVCWSAKKQSSVAMSSAEAEYVAAAGCCAQVLWIKSQLADYDVLYDKVPIFCDNTSAIAISNNPVLHSRTKHIDIRYHFIRDHILKGDIELHFVPTELQLADIFTKPLAEPSFTRLVAELGMLNIEKQVSDKKKALSDL